MKNATLIISLFCGSVSGTALAGDDAKSIEILERKAISITINASNNGEPVSGALVKILGDGMVIGAGNTDASGAATISIPQYGKQVLSLIHI